MVYLFQVYNCKCGGGGGGGSSSGGGDKGENLNVIINNSSIIRTTEEFKILPSYILFTEILNSTLTVVLVYTFHFRQIWAGSLVHYYLKSFCYNCFENVISSTSWVTLYQTCIHPFYRERATDE